MIGFRKRRNDLVDELDKTLADHQRRTNVYNEALVPGDAAAAPHSRPGRSARRSPHGAPGSQRTRAVEAKLEGWRAMVCVEDVLRGGPAVDATSRIRCPSCTPSPSMSRPARFLTVN
jgi:hypothetical protein